MALDTYKELGKTAKKFLNEYSGKDVIVKDAQNQSVLFGGTLDFDEREPDVYYLSKESVTRKFRVKDLEKLIVSLDA